MRKFLGILAIVLLCSSPVLAQIHDSDPQELQFNYTLLGGAQVQFTISTITWGNIMPPLSELQEWLPSLESFIDVNLVWKFDGGNKAVIVSEATTDFEADGHTMAINDFLRQSWNGYFSYPATNVAPVGMQDTIWDSSGEIEPARGQITTQCLFELNNTLNYGHIDKFYSGIVIYTILEQVI